ncbi:Vitamin B12-dependent ribonucleotide reductase [Anaerohalosphaera lusitana]|uniref:Vitamin B12-dependent ribonucleotide reductase n=1 Tax=Anaerohalosphaera lusitana TaxID=1936003 RepID=A0A1U9NHR3_9BACT|nr:vitamin B12-dependent ribonucleotide reductase [Anaerohalosphaera lusitana]AQT67461.1 Vitamin B12-dependent ribonucleotide reductase [Anaerohalosphaera lusitana]
MAEGISRDKSKDGSFAGFEPWKDSSSGKNDGLKVGRTFSDPSVHPFDELEWDKREAKIAGDNGEVIFEQKDVEVPKKWSQLAAKVVVSKYFYGDHETGERENSVKQLIHRVCRTIADRGKQDGYFASDEDAENFYHELTWLCVNQYGAFNSPVWFNVGLYDVYGVEGSKHNFYWDAKKGKAVECPNSYKYPQASACFIQSVDDSMEDIMRLAKSEAMLFKHGSGTGTDLSTLRSSKEKLSGGGKPSGPLSFMRVFDQIAGVIKSGGKTRRAAKMQSLMVTHPDIREFITCKTEEEKKAWALIEEGYQGEMNSEAYSSVMFQNANLSVRVTDNFMDAVQKDAKWETVSVTTGEKVQEHRAAELWELIAEGTRVCGDPGLQYHTTINKWHTCPNSGPINASNPCSEYMFVNDSACNLASLNLMKFRTEDGSFDIERFKEAVRIYIIAQEILVDNGSYPEARITENSHKFRPLGLGFANLGSLIMSMALPYDSDEGRAWAGAIGAIMTGTAYSASAELAGIKGAFDEYEKNKDPMLKVIGMHRERAYNIPTVHCPEYLVNAAKDAWDDAISAGSKYGFRNAQATVLAPTGTIGFMMDCDTTGVEPDIALVKYKLLAGGGMFKIVNRTVPMALEALGYSAEEIKKICDTIDQDDTIETSDVLNEEHLPVFDCAFQARKGKRYIHYLAHLRMMAAVQPFISGAISKTINMPHESTTEQIMEAYMEGWKLGLKAVAIYRDGSKRMQPVNTDDKSKKKEKKAVAEEAPVAKPYRRRLPETRQSLTHKFSVAGHEGYLTVGLYEDGQPGELFITMAKEGSTVGGLMDVIGTCVSMSLQYGVPLVTLVDKFRHARFEPAGMTSNRDIPFAKSLIDYIFCWLGCQFIPGYAEKNTPNRPKQSKSAKKEGATAKQIVEKTKDLAKKIDEAKAIKKDGGSEKAKKPAEPRDKDGKGVKPEGPRFTDSIADKAVAAVSTVVKDGNGDGEAGVMQQFNSQFEHFQDDAPACDVCGSLTVRNGTCYKCFNCGNSMGCS